MTRYLASRLIGLLPIFLGISVVAFCPIRLIPGDLMLRLDEAVLAGWAKQAKVPAA